MTSIKMIARLVFFSGLILFFTSVVWAESDQPEPQPVPLHQPQNPQQPSLIEETPITDKDQFSLADATPEAVAPIEIETLRISGKFKKIDFEHSVCFRCHQVSDFKPSDKTEQQWRMLIEKNQHDIFKKIVWDYPDQKEQILTYLVEHAGGSGAEGIGVWH